MLETISLKLDDSLLREIDSTLTRHRYSTRTEFIRDSIRDKLTELERNELLQNIARLRGASKRRTSDRQLEKARRQAFSQLEKSMAKGH
jgi:metal-responsive CopG/Arc/MetJ family transcriptional regulator